MHTENKDCVHDIPGLGAFDTACLTSQGTTFKAGETIVHETQHALSEWSSHEVGNVTEDYAQNMVCGVSLNLYSIQQSFYLFHSEFYFFSN